MQLAACEPNFYSGWRRAAIVMIVDLLLICFWVEEEGRIMEIHPSIHQLFGSALVFFVDAAGRL
jgi:hypothetical protein